LTETNTAAARMSADPDSRAVAVAAARAASDKQASRIVILDVREPIVITDYLVICTASSTRQIRTVIDEIERATREMGVKPMRREGESETGWWLLDYFEKLLPKAHYRTVVLRRPWVDGCVEDTIGRHDRAG